MLHLDLDKIAPGELEILRRPFPLQAVFGETADTVRPLCVRQDLMLVVDAPDVTVNIDPGRLRQVLTNLVSNAIRFSPTGGTVWMVAEVDGDDLRLVVRDLGRGIPNDKLEVIFERLQEADPSDAGEENGGGPGLATCRGLVALHGGTLRAESGSGRGSTFTAFLPGTVIIH